MKSREISWSKIGFKSRSGHSIGSFYFQVYFSSYYTYIEIGTNSLTCTDLYIGVVGGEIDLKIKTSNRVPRLGFEPTASGFLIGQHNH